MGMMQTK